MSDPTTDTLAWLFAASVTVTIAPDPDPHNDCTLAKVIIRELPGKPTFWGDTIEDALTQTREFCQSRGIVPPVLGDRR